MPHVRKARRVPSAHTRRTNPARCAAPRSPLRTRKEAQGMSKPAIQNIPLRTELGRAIRKAFAGEKPMVIGADYAAIEEHLLAHMSAAEREAFFKGMRAKEPIIQPCPEDFGAVRNLDNGAWYFPTVEQGQAYERARAEWDRKIGRLRIEYRETLPGEIVSVTFAGEPIAASYVQIKQRSDRPMRLRDRRRRARKLRKLCRKAGILI